MPARRHFGGTSPLMGDPFLYTEDLKEGVKCNVKILLSRTNNEVSVRVDGTVVRCNPGTVAIKFSHIDPESLFHLHNIVRYNCPDPESIEREIQNHPGI